MLVCSVVGTTDGWAQVTGEDVLLQLGIGVLPGVGMQAAYIDQRRMYTRDAVFYGHVQPGFFENDGSVQVSGALGFSVRIIGILVTTGAISDRGYDIDIGARLGPGLTFGFSETPLEKNQRFSLTLEPTLRMIKEIGSRRYYLETGIVRPSIRMGALISL